MFNKTKMSINPPESPAAKLAPEENKDAAQPISLKWDEVDFSSLEPAPGIEKLIGKINLVKLICLALLLLSVPLSVYFALIGVTSYAETVAILAAAWAVILILRWFFSESLYTKIKQLESHKLEEFAADNSFSFSEMVSTKQKTGGLFKGQTSGRKGISGQINGWGFDVYMVDMFPNNPHQAADHPAKEYEMNLDSYLIKDYPFMVVEIKLDHNFPHICIFSRVKRTGLLSSQSRANFGFKSSDRLKLSQEFDKYIEAYAPTDYQVAVFNLLTPDVMDLIINFEQVCNIEIVGNRMFFYFRNDHRAKSFKQALQQSMDLLNLIGSRLSRGNIYGSQKQSTLHQKLRSTDHVVRSSGARRQKNRWALAIFLPLIFMVIFYTAWAALTDLSVVPAIILHLLVLMTVLSVCVFVVTISLGIALSVFKIFSNIAGRIRSERSYRQRRRHR